METMTLEPIPTDEFAQAYAKIKEGRFRKKDPVFLYSQQNDCFYYTTVSQLRREKPDQDKIGIICRVEDLSKYIHINSKTQFGLCGTDDQPLYDSDINIFGLDAFQNMYPYSGIEAFNAPEYMEILPYKELYDFAYCRLYQEYPQVEQLCKAGFARFIYQYLYSEIFSGETDLSFTCFDLLFQQGNDVAEITNLKNSQWQTLLKYTDSFRTWGRYSKFIRDNEIDGKKLERLLKLEYRKSDCSSLDMISEILYSYGHLYTLDSLLRYMESIESKQGLEPWLALNLLRDYLDMCSQAHVIPNVCSDNLERDHALIQNGDNEEIIRESRKPFTERYCQLKKYAYSDEYLQVIVPEKPEDLINEGRNNHNCVGSYISRHANGACSVFFIRKKEDIEKSYITLELSNDHYVKQAFYSCNRPVDKREDREFIKTWLNDCVKKGSNA